MFALAQNPRFSAGSALPPDVRRWLCPAVLQMISSLSLNVDRAPQLKERWIAIE